MDHFEARDPYPEIAGFSVKLPNVGAYVYSQDTAIMFNSGLIATRDGATIEDAVALIDALWDADRRRFNIEQIAVSEAFRAAGATIGETFPAFQHYFRRSLKRYMHWRIDAWIGGHQISSRRDRALPRLAMRSACSIGSIGRWEDGFRAIAAGATTKCHSRESGNPGGRKADRLR